MIKNLELLEQICLDVYGCCLADIHIDEFERLRQIIMLLWLFDIEDDEDDFESSFVVSEKENELKRSYCTKCWHESDNCQCNKHEIKELKFDYENGYCSSCYKLIQSHIVPCCDDKNCRNYCPF